MRTTHNSHIPGSQGIQVDEPTCNGYPACQRCRAESQVYWRSLETRQYKFLVVAREFMQLSGTTPEEAKEAFQKMFDINLVDEQLLVEVNEYLDERIKNS